MPGLLVIRIQFWKKVVVEIFCFRPKIYLSISTSWVGSSGNRDSFLSINFKTWFLELLILKVRYWVDIWKMSQWENFEISKLFVSKLLSSDKCSLEHVPAVNLNSFLTGFAIKAELPRANYNWYLPYWDAQNSRLHNFKERKEFRGFYQRFFLFFLECTNYFYF